MSTRHRWLAVYLAFTVSFPISVPNSFAGPKESEQPSGQVGLRELIALALQNDPELVTLRLNIPVEEAKKRAAKQWRDPEIRFGYSKEGDVQLPQPYTEHGSFRESIGGGGTKTNSDGSESETSQELRSGSYKQTVTPGEKSNQIHRTESETRTTTTTGPDGVEREQENFNSTTDETRYHGLDPLARDESAVVKIRFWIPKPWEMKALVNQAAKQIELANYEVTAAERRVILDVRADYENLQFLYKRLQVDRNKITVIEKHVAKEDALLDAGGDFTLDQLNFESIQIPGIKLEIDSRNMELKAAKRELAARVGLDDGSRIRVTDQLLRSNIDLQGTDLDYLTRMAFAFRGEVGILKHEQAIAEGDLALVKSKRIPWLSFLEAAYGRDERGGNHRNDNYGVQFGVVLPLFSWLGKDEEVVQARIESYYGSLAANQKNIANEVAEAFRSVKDAAKHRTRAKTAIAKYSNQLAEEAKRLDASDDLAAKEKLRYEVEIQRDGFSKYTLEADRRFNKSLIRLELALGADLDQVFNFKFENLDGDQASVEITAAAAAFASELTAPRAKPVPKKIELGTPRNLGPAPDAKPDQAKPWNLFKRSKKNQSNKKPAPRKGFSNR